MIRTPLLVCLLVTTCLGQTSAPSQGPRNPPPVLPLPKAVALLRKAKITVDGSLADWPNLPPLLLDDPRQLSGTQLGASHGPRDLSAHAFLVWDEEDLYFAAVVADDWHRELEQKSLRLTEVPSCDSVVLTFDPDRDTRSLGADDGRKEDREFWLGAIKGGEQRLVLWDRYRGTARFAEGTLAISRDKERALTTYEARIPWKEVLPPGRKPTRGTVLRLQAVVNDYDEPTDTMPQSRVGWTFGSFADRIDPGVLGSVMLIDALSESDPRLPDFPAGPELKGDPVPGQKYWIELGERLSRHPPKRFGVSVGEASAVSGAERRSALDDLDHQIATFPRVDCIEYLQRIDRRMLREVRGIAAAGLPYFWQLEIEEIGRGMAKAAPERPTITRLPQGGWLIRGGGPCLVIDACGANVEHALLNGCDAALQTDVYDIGKRSDQMLLGMLATKKRVVMHLALHLPRLAADQLPLTMPGKTVEVGSLKIQVLGTLDAKGMVSMQVGYLVTWPDGTTLLVAPASMVEEQFPRGVHPDVLILSALNPRAQALGELAKAGMTVLDDILVPPVFPGAGARVSIAAVYELQGKLLPNASIVLGPGDTCAIPKPAGPK